MPLKPAAIALGVASPLLLHAAIPSGYPALAAGGTALFALLMLWHKLAPVLRAALLAVALVACGIAAWSDAAALSFVYLAPVAIYLAVGVVFGRSLLPGREPLVARIARIDRGDELPNDLARHARGVTWSWTVLMALFIAMSTGLALFGTPAAWSWFNNVLAFVLMAAMFAGEYFYRVLRFRHYPHNNPFRVAIMMVRHAPELLR